MRQWRQHLHQFPETAFEETKTAQFIAKLASFGLDVHQGFGRTGVVATLSAGNSDQKIALRVDMDALFIQEQSTFAYKSCHDGKMHACGHDGHTAMLLGAASYQLSTATLTLRYIFSFRLPKKVAMVPDFLLGTHWYYKPGSGKNAHDK